MHCWDDIGSKEVDNEKNCCGQKRRRERTKDRRHQFINVGIFTSASLIGISMHCIDYSFAKTNCNSKIICRLADNENGMTAPLLNLNET